MGAALIAFAQVVGRRIDTYDASSARSWVPLVLLLAGIGVLAFGAITLGRTVKRHAPPKRSAIDQELPVGAGGAPRFQIDPMAWS